MKKILYILGVMLAVASCTKTDEGFDNPNSGEGAVQFMASAPTRVTEDSEWQADDRIGVFAGSVSNTEYKIKADNNGVMEYVSGAEIYTPSSSQNYFAYYPYDADINDSKLSVDLVANQLPLVWAKPEEKSGSSVTFDFKHQLVKLNLTFKAGGLDIANLDGATATLKGANTKGEFDVVTGAWNSSATVAEDLPLTIATTEKSITLTSYVMPTTSPNANTTIEISADGKSFVWQPTTTAWEIGNSYDYNVTVGVGTISGFTIGTNNEDNLIFNPIVGTVLSFEDVTFVETKIGASSPGTTADLGASMNSDGVLSFNTEKVVNADDLAYVSITFTTTRNSVVSDPTTLDISSLFAVNTTADKLRIDKEKFTGMPTTGYIAAGFTGDCEVTPTITLSSGVSVPSTQATHSDCGAEASSITVFATAGGNLMVNYSIAPTSVAGIFFDIPLLCEGTIYVKRNYVIMQQEGFF